MTTLASERPIAPVLILGAGVNGLCVARELALNGVPIVVVDIGDVGGGASAKSSRLIHGGLRYLEYGEFRLVRESLEERARLLRLAPQFVRPLKLHIPARRRRGGLIHAAVRFLGLSRVGWLQRCLAACRIPSERGRWAAQLGLTLYDWIARHGGLPRHSVLSVGAAAAPPVDGQEYRWICSYWDAQMLSPERFCLALWKDARIAAGRQGQRCELYSYHHVELTDEGVAILPVGEADATVAEFRPAMVVNSTGAWGDLTLKSLPIEAPRLFGGTRGSHIVSRQPQLLEAIGNAGIYAEARDGRLVFILPWGPEVLIGTTDIRHESAPDAAVATDDEVAYLVRMVNEVFPQVALTVDDVCCHYSGVRPLPYVQEGKTAAISRDHTIDVRTAPNGLRIDTLVGGKLTTCRAFGEEVADRVLDTLGTVRTADTCERPVPGGENYPRTPDDLHRMHAELAETFALSVKSVAACWSLFGTDTAEVLQLSRAECTADDWRQGLPGTALPVAVVDWIIRNELVQSVADLVERRLLLVFAEGLQHETLGVLEQRIRAVRGNCRDNAEQAAQRLATQYGVRLA
ncbi:MAG: glycerol-3-phosphate dehydrogenase/oxidase [Planctomycetaceae bacterium]